MGKTYRREKGECAKKRSRLSPHPSCSPEQAIAKVSKHVDMALEKLIESGRILYDDKEDLQWQVYAEVVAKMDDYDPDYVSEKSGKKASFDTYLKRMADYALGHLMQEREERATSVEAEVRIAALPPMEAHALGYISENDVSLAVGCRSLRDLFLRMDLNYFVGTLTPRELLVLRLRLANKTFREMEPIVGVPFQNICTRIMPSIQRKAIDCGFDAPPGFVLREV